MSDAESEYHIELITAALEAERASHERTKADWMAAEKDAAMARDRQATAERHRDEARDERDAAQARARFWKAGARHLYQLRQGDVNGYWRDYHAANARVERLRADAAQAYAALMRQALANVLGERYRLGDFAEKAERMAEVARHALDGTTVDARKVPLEYCHCASPNLAHSALCINCKRPVDARRGE